MGADDEDSAGLPLRCRRTPLRLTPASVVGTAALLLFGAAPIRSTNAPTPAEADRFVVQAEARLVALTPDVHRAEWLSQTYVTDDSERVHVRLAAELGALRVALRREAFRFRGLTLNGDTARKIALLASADEDASPVDPSAGLALSAVRASLASANARRRFAVGSHALENYGEVRDAMEPTADPRTLAALWAGWADSGAAFRGDYERFVALQNQGARDAGYRDAAALRQSANGMAPGEAAALTHELWGQLRPLYTELHCYVRARLNQTYGDDVQPRRGAIRIDLTRNPVGMYWRGLADLATTPKTGGPSVDADVERRLAERAMTGRDMAKLAEGFYVSLGYSPLDERFWARSLFEKPKDHIADCNGSTTPIDGTDVRLKFCTATNLAGLRTAVHEIGHVFYARSYAAQPFLYREGASDAFHEGLADFPLLSMNRTYFEKVGLIDTGGAESPDAERRALLDRALERLPLLAFAVALEDWRWGVFSGAIAPDQYNSAWWRIVGEVQGLAPPTPRLDGAFDAAAVPHVLNDTPYNRYFFAGLLQHQFFAAACRQAGWTGPLQRCSVYGSKAVGERIRAMSSMGASKPWPDALEAFTGDRAISAGGLLAYYAPLRPWLQQQIGRETCGW